MNAKPIVGITMGDPAGNGPEITVKALAHAEVYDSCRPHRCGRCKDHRTGGPFRRPSRYYNSPLREGKRRQIPAGRHRRAAPWKLIPDVEKFPIGQVSIEGGNAAFQCVKKGD